MRQTPRTRKENMMNAHAAMMMSKGCKVVILRGISGSGKSTYTKKNHPTALICSADDFFICKDGVYRFDAKQLGEAHKWCMNRFVHSCMQNLPEIVVDNTNTQLWEMSGYVQVAESQGYEVQIVRMETPVSLCAERNTHGVPLKAVQGMADRFQKVLPWWKETVVKGTE